MQRNLITIHLPKWTQKKIVLHLDLEEWATPISFEKCTAVFFIKILCLKIGWWGTHVDKKDNFWTGRVWKNISNINIKDMDDVEELFIKKYGKDCIRGGSLSTKFYDDKWHGNKRGVYVNHSIGYFIPNRIAKIPKKLWEDSVRWEEVNNGDTKKRNSKKSKSKCSCKKNKK